MISSTLIASLLLFAQTTSAPEAAFRSAIEDFEFGEHAKAAEKLRSVLEPIQLESREDVIVARQYLGACYHLLDDRVKAKKEFSMLLALDSSHKLDPEVFSPALVQFFEEVRAEAGLALAKPPPKTLGAGLPPPPPPPPPPLGRAPMERPSTEPHSAAISLIPFGVGQFANRHPVRGTVFAASEVGLYSTALATFLMFEGLKQQSPDGTTFFAAEDESRARSLQTVYLVTFWAGVAVMAAGIVEALVSYPGDVPPLEPSGSAATRAGGPFQIRF